MQYIKSKLLRFLVSLFITLILYFGLAFLMSENSIEEAFKIMLTLFIFGFFVVPPILIFMGYVIYTQLTPVGDRETKNIKKLLLSTLAVIVAILLFLYALAMYSGTLD